jgi:translation initiation factor IF-1
VPGVSNRVAGVVLAELPQLVFRVEVGKGREVLAHAVGMAERNFVRLLPGDKVEIELAAQDQTRGRILKKL